MRITEEPIKPGLSENIEGSASEGAKMIGVAMDATPLEVVTAIHAYVSKPPKKRRVDNWEARALPLGSLWGCQLVRQFGWEWSAVVFHDQGDSKAVGVFSKDRSLAVYPWHFIFGCLENDAPVTILLAFNMLLAGQIPPQEAEADVNLMEHDHYIVPPG